MANSVYWAISSNQFTGPFEEGDVLPLFRVADDDPAKLIWAYAVPRLPAPQNNLVHAVLRALGFRLDDNSASHTCDFFYVDESPAVPLLGRLEIGWFANHPTGPPTGDPLEVLLPPGADLLNASDTAHGLEVRAGARFGVHFLSFHGQLDAGTNWPFTLGAAGGACGPQFSLRLRPSEELASMLPEGVVPELHFSHGGGSRKLQFFSRDLLPNNADISGNDTRHDRLIDTTAAIICQTAGGQSRLAVDLFPSFAFQPQEGLPLTVSVGNGGLALRLHPADDAKKATLHFNVLDPCLHVSLRGPLVHADSSTGGLSQWLKLLEPAEREVRGQIERINDFLTYRFAICLPKAAVKDLTLPNLEEFDQFGLEFTKLSDAVQFLDELRNFKLIDLFHVSFSDIGLPSLTRYRIDEFTVDASGTLQVKVVDSSGTDVVLPALTEGYLWSLIWKQPGGTSIELEVDEAVAPAAGYTRGFKLKQPIELPRGRGSFLELSWRFKPEIADVVDNHEQRLRVTLSSNLPELANFRPELLKVRFRRFNFDVITFGAVACTPTTIDLNAPFVDGKFPELEKLKSLITVGDISVEISLDLSFPLTKCFLNDLLGDVPAVDFRLSIPRLGTWPEVIDATTIAPPRFSFKDFDPRFPVIPFELIVRLPSEIGNGPNSITVSLALKFDLLKGRLVNSRLYFFLPQLDSGEGIATPRQAVDFDIFTLTFPNRPHPLGVPSKDDHDGYLDLVSREFVIDLLYPPSRKPKPQPRVRLYFPGGMSPEAARLGREGIAELRMGNDKEQANRLQREYNKRFELELDDVNPLTWPEAGSKGETLCFRLNGKGLTFAANVGQTEVLVDDSGFDGDGKAEPGSGGLIKQVKFKPQDKQRELHSRVVIIDNELKEAGVYAKTDVPGVDNLMADVSVVLRQPKKGKRPDVLASLELERPDETPLAEFSVKLLELSLDRIQMALSWQMEEKEWDYSVVADGTVSFTSSAKIAKDLEGLRGGAIKVIGLDLRKLNLRAIRIPFDLVKPVRFEILDGMFAVELGDLEVEWIFKDKKPQLKQLVCEYARFEYLNPGTLEVKITVGGLTIEFDTDKDMSAHIKLPSSLGIEVALGPTVRFAGQVGWTENEKERFLFASGTVALEGLPEISGLLKFGTGLKDSGRREINLALYGAMALDKQLYTGVVVKELGLGIGLNNRLAAIPAKPSADAIIRRIDQLNPGDVSGWQFVREGGFYLSIVGSVTLASNLGEPDVINAYVAQLIVSFDTNLDIVAAGKVWLSCSVTGQKKHPNQPAFVGAMVLSPKQQKLELVLESRKDPFVEDNALIEQLLSKAKVRFAFRMTPRLVDFQLAELSYRDEMFGAQVVVLGEYRFAIFKRAVLLRSELTATGTISRSLTAGPGGFDMDGKATFAVGYGGLLDQKNVMAYAFIEASIQFRVSAWIEIGFSISVKICGKRYTKSWTIVFRMRAPSVELTFLGHIALLNAKPSVDCQVGINIVICGYRLHASGRLSINPEIYEQVRERVAAFEKLLNNAVSELDQSGDSNQNGALEAPAGAGGGAGQAEAGPAFELAPEPPAAEADTLEVAAVESAPEKWLLQRRRLQNADVLLLLPSDDTPWLTPRMATISKIVAHKEGDTQLVTLTVLHPHSPLRFLKESNRVRLLGIRHPGLLSLNEKSLTVKKADDTSVTLLAEVSLVDQEVSDPGGLWFAEEDFTRFRPAKFESKDQDTVHYLGDVERVAIRIGPWMEVADFGENNILTLSDNHLLTSSVRLMLRKAKDADSIVDLGEHRDFGPNDRSSVTVAATPVPDESAKLALEMGDFSDPPAAGWCVAVAVEIAPTWNARNRIAELREVSDSADEQRVAEDIRRYRRRTGEAASWAETALPEGMTTSIVPPRDSYGSVFDERYTTKDPRFSPLELASSVPPAVLPARFQPLENFEIVGSDRILAAARRFELAMQALARQELHGTLDLRSGDQLQQSRAQASQLLVHRLSDPELNQESGHDEAPLCDLSNGHEAIAYGWLLKTAPDSIPIDRLAAEPLSVFVRRSNEAAWPVLQVTVAAPDDSKVLAPHCLPPRQEYVVDDAAEQTERGRVLVRLPIRFSDAQLRRHLDRVAKLQIYRKFPSGREQLIADEIRPNISFLDQPQVFSRRERGFVAETARPNNDVTLARDFLFLAKLSAGGGKHAELTVASSEANALPANEDQEGVHLLEGLSCRCLRANQPSFIGKVTKVSPSSANDLSITIDGEIPDDAAQGFVGFELIATGLIVPRPILFTDEFEVVGREFVEPELRFAHGAGGLPQVTYSLQLLTEDDPGGVSVKTKIPWPGEVALYIPTRSQLPPSLALAIPVAGLVRSAKPDREPDGLLFQLVALGGPAPTLALNKGRPFSIDDFEFWVDDGSMKQSGFFAGETSAEEITTEIDGERVSLADVRNVSELESAAGKTQVPVELVDADQGVYRLRPQSASAQLVEGATYRVFLRSRNETSTKALQRVSILLIRELPPAWDESVRFRVTETLEIIPAGHRELVACGLALPLENDFSADDLYQSGLSAIRAVWPSQSLLDGGVELQFRDFDESSLRSRTLIEVLEPEQFSRSQPDFRDETFWKLRPAQQLDRYATRGVVADVKFDPEEADKFTENVLEPCYRWTRTDKKDPDRKEIDAIVRLRTALAAFNPFEQLDKPLTWIDVASAARTVQVALLAFEKSPINPQSPALRSLIQGIRLSLRALLVGSKGAESGSTLEAAHQSLLSWLIAVEELRPESVGEGIEQAAVFLDRDTSRKLAGIVRRRLAIADEVMSLADLNSLAPLEGDSQTVLLARAQAWIDTRDSVRGMKLDDNELASAMPRLQELDRLMGAVADHQKIWKDNLDACKRDIEVLIETIKQLKLGRTVPRAAGLSDLLARLDGLLRSDGPQSPAGVIKRPHHELTTTRNEQGEIVARKIALRALLPPEARRAAAGTVPPEPDKTMQRLGARVGQVVTLSKDGQLSIWSTRGQSLASPLERIQQFQLESPAEIVAKVELCEVSDGPRVLVSAKFGTEWTAGLWYAATGLKDERPGLSWKLAEAASPGWATVVKTPRGVEVAVAQNDRIQLASIESERTAILFKEKDGTGFTKSVAYHDEMRVLAAVRTNTAEIETIVFWRDLGRSSHEIPFARITLKQEAIVDIQSVTLPVGKRFVVATTHSVLLIDPTRSGRGVEYDPANKGGTLGIVPLFHDSTKKVSALAVDRRELCALVLADQDLHSLDLVRHKHRLLVHFDKAPNACLAILHAQRDGTDESFAVVAANAVGAPDRAGEVELWNAANAETREQILPAGRVFSSTAENAEEVVAVGSALVTARSARAANDIMSLFHLWERMGFAVDIAAQDSTTRLLSLGELQRYVRQALASMPHDEDGRLKINETLHRVYLVEGEEPDAEFQPNGRVGFSHMKLAIVPDAFLQACLADNMRVVLPEWLKYRAIDVPAIPPDATPPDAKTPDIGAAELEHVVYLTRLLGICDSSRYGKLEHALPPRLEDRQNAREVLAMQPRSERFLRVPASAGISHWSWTLPDRKGHRMLVAARRVSRYEPLLRWWLNSRVRFDLPDETPLAPKNASGPSYRPIKAVMPASVELDVELEQASGHQPLRVEILSGKAKGQQREVLAVDGPKLLLDPGDPWLIAPKNGDICRVMDAAPGWRQVDIAPTHDPATGAGAAPLTVYQYPHARRLRFSYQIPLDGMRSTYNQISRVRTGFQGVETVFRYYLPEGIDKPDTASLSELLAGILSDPLPILAATRSVLSVPLTPTKAVKLFRHERLVTLPELPFYYRYRFDVRSAYHARRLQHDRVTAADQLPEDENASPSAERQPARLGMNDIEVRYLAVANAGTLPGDQPSARQKVRLTEAEVKLLVGGGAFLRVRPTEADDWSARRIVVDWSSEGDTVIATLDHEIPDHKPLAGWRYELSPQAVELNLLVSANGDHLTREEEESEEPQIEVATPFTTRPVAARNLPDFFMDYALFSKAFSGNGNASPLPDRSATFVSTGMVRMPWSTQFNPAVGLEKHMAWVSVASGFKCQREFAIVPPGQTAEGTLKIAEIDVLKQFSDAWQQTATKISVYALVEDIDGVNLSITRDGATARVPLGVWTTVWEGPAGSLTADAQLTIEGRLRLLVQVVAGDKVLLATGQEISVPLEHVTTGGANPQDFWRLRFRLLADPGQTSLADAADLFVQGIRGGVPTRAMPARLQSS